MNSALEAAVYNLCRQISRMINFAETSLWIYLKVILWWRVKEKLSKLCSTIQPTHTKRDATKTGVAGQKEEKSHSDNCFEKIRSYDSLKKIQIFFFFVSVTSTRRNSRLSTDASLKKLSSPRSNRFPQPLNWVTAFLAIKYVMNQLLNCVNQVFSTEFKNTNI